MPCRVPCVNVQCARSLRRSPVFASFPADADRKSAMFREWKTSWRKNNRRILRDRFVRGKLRKCKLAIEQSDHAGTKGGNTWRRRATSMQPATAPQRRPHQRDWPPGTGTTQQRTANWLQLLKRHFTRRRRPQSKPARPMHQHQQPWPPSLSTSVLSLFAKTITLLILLTPASCQERSKTLYIAGFFPTSRDIPQGSIGRGVLPAVKLALQHVNDSPHFGKYKLDLVWNNTKVRQPFTHRPLFILHKLAQCPPPPSLTFGSRQMFVPQCPPPYCTLKVCFFIDDNLYQSLTCTLSALRAEM